MALQRVDTISIDWSNQDMHARPLGSRVVCRLSAAAVQLLDFFTEPQQIERAVAEFGSDDPENVRKAIALLQSGGLLRETTTPADERGTEPWWTAWGPAARTFHYATRDASFAKFRSEHSQHIDEQNSREPTPALYKAYPDAPQLPLPRTFEPLDIPIGQALRRRRTHRDFEPDHVTIDQFTTVMHYAFGVLRFHDTGVYGTQLAKASPAGGSRHDIECYVACFTVDTIPPGLYHYRVDTHALELIDADFPRDLVRSLTADQDHCGGAAFTCFLTSVPERIAHKYRHPRAYRTWMYNVGHTAQTFALVATALGLGAFQTMAFEDSAVEKALRLDPMTEFPTYVVGAGIPQTTRSKLPLDFRPVRAGQEQHEDGTNHDDRTL